MALITRPTMVDDSGVFTDGTAVNKAFIDSIIDEVDDQTHSSTNPGQTPAETTDEVIAARGNLASLDARLDGVVDADGNPVPSVSAVTEAQAGALPTTNVVLNETFIIWAAGDSVAPTGWTLAGTGAVCARAGTGMASTARKVGDFCPQLTFGSTTLTLAQDVLPTAAFGRLNHLQGEDVALGAWVFSEVATQARIYVSDGVSSGYSQYHTGDGTWQWLTVQHTLSGSASKLTVGVSVEAGSGNSVYLSGPTLIFGTVAPTGWRPTPTVCGTVSMSIAGEIATGAGQGFYTYNRMGIIKDIECNLRTAPTGATTFKIDVNKGGVTMLASVIAFVASDKNAGKVPDGNYDRRCFAGGSLHSGTTITDELTFDVDAVGNTIAGSNLSVKFRTMVYVDPFESVKDA